MAPAQFVFGMKKVTIMRLMISARAEKITKIRPEIISISKKKIFFNKEY